MRYVFHNPMLAEQGWAVAYIPPFHIAGQGLYRLRLYHGAEVEELKAETIEELWQKWLDLCAEILKRGE